MKATEEFTNFQLEEYKNISSAHFETNKQIALFFRYYLLIASSPTIIVIFLDKSISKLNSLLNGNLEFMETLFVGILLMIIAGLGFSICLYITNLLNDSSLYAKTVNGSRRFFYDLESKKYDTRYRVLPKITSEPTLSSQSRYSLPILYTIYSINSIYFVAGTYIISLIGKDLFWKKIILFPNYSCWHILAVFISCFFLQRFFAKRISNYRNYSYLKSFIIGVDIDGVLNKHRRTFCTKLWEVDKVTLGEDEINKIPVSLIPNKNITRQNEYNVFNSPDYWIRQEPIDNYAASVIDELKHSFGYKINIFSFRPWPDLKYLNPADHIKTLKNWWKFKERKRNLHDKKWYRKLRVTILSWNWLRWKLNKSYPFILWCIKNTSLYKRKLKYRKIKKLTKNWLRKNNFHYNKLIIETNGIDNPPAKGLFKIPRFFFRNRYFHANRYHFRYFVEDTPENAIKLSYSCDYVFLINHPYNTEEQYPKMPKNIIRVNNWGEIKNKIQELG